MRLLPFAKCERKHPVVAGKRGTLELDTPAGGQISALGIRATPGGAITTVPVLAK